MSAKSIVLVAIDVVSMYCATIWAHTESEYLNMARNMIGTLQSLDWECEEELLERQESDDPLYHWDYTSQALDDVFVAAFPGYDFSSNRLDYANHVLSWTTNNDWRAMRDHFVAITNQLHSLGLPLVELNLDESTPNHE